MTGDTRTQVAGAVQQVKGKVETAVGKMKDGVRYANADLEAQHKAKREADRRVVPITGEHNIM
jgi:hypothetical protein